MMGSWSTFFGAVISASATLAGLVFVCVSINLKQILDEPSLPARAAEAILLLTGCVLEAGLMLVPMTEFAKSVALLVLAILVWASLTGLHILSYRKMRREYRAHSAKIMLAAQAGVLLIGAGAIVGLVSPMPNLYLVAAGQGLSIVVAIVLSWFLLIEINR